MFFAGWVTSLFYIPKRSDKYGRKFYIMTGLLLEVSMLVIIYFTTSIEITIFAMFLVGLS